MSLSYLEAHRQLTSGSISWEGYIDQLLVRCTPAGGHSDDDVDGIHHDLRDTDPFAYMIWTFSEGKWIQDIIPFKAVFTTYRDGSLDDLKQKLSAVPEEFAVDMRGCLALLALQERRPAVLKLCFDRGSIRYSRDFEDEANRVDEAKDPETFKVLEESEFRQVYPRRPLLTGEEKDNEDLDDADEDYDEDPVAVFDVGGSHPVDW